MSNMVFANLSPLPPSTILAFTDYEDFCMLFRGSEFSVSKNTLQNRKKISIRNKDALPEQGGRLETSCSILHSRGNRKAQVTNRHLKEFSC